MSWVSVTEGVGGSLLRAGQQANAEHARLQVPQSSLCRERAAAAECGLHSAAAVAGLGVAVAVAGLGAVAGVDCMVLLCFTVATLAVAVVLCRLHGGAVDWLVDAVFRCLSCFCCGAWVSAP